MSCCAHSLISAYERGLTAIQRGIFSINGMQIPKYGAKSMTKEEQQFADWFRHEKILICDMSDAELRERHELVKVTANEARAYQSADEDEIRERRAKNGKKEWLVTDNSISSSDAINAPKLRQTRMSKMDKLQQQLLAAGIDEDTVKQMVADMSKRATDKQVKTITFKKPGREEIGAVSIELPKPPSEPFNPLSIKFGG